MSVPPSDMAGLMDTRLAAHPGRVGTREAYHQETTLALSLCSGEALYVIRGWRSPGDDEKRTKEEGEKNQRRRKVRATKEEVKKK